MLGLNDFTDISNCTETCQIHGWCNVCEIVNWVATKFVPLITAIIVSTACYR